MYYKIYLLYKYHPNLALMILTILFCLQRNDENKIKKPRKTDFLINIKEDYLLGGVGNIDRIYIN